MENGNSSPKKPNKTFLAANIVIAVVLIFALAMLTLQYYRNLNRELFEERQEHLTEFTEKTAELIGKSNENAVDHLNACAYALAWAETYKNDEMQGWLEYLKGLAGEDDMLVILFDKKGNYYSSDGASGYWQESDFLQSTGDGINIAVMSCPHESNVTRMIYARKLENEVKLDGGAETITHIAVAVDSDTFRSEMSVTGYGKDCCTFITNKSGRRIYQYTYDNNGFLSGYNLITEIEKQETVNIGKFESLSAAIEAHETYAYEFSYRDEEAAEAVRWFVGVSYIDDADWVVLLLVPTNSLGSSTSFLVSETISFFVLIAAAFILIFIAVFVMVMKIRTSRKLLEHQEKVSERLKAAADEADSANKAKTEFLSHMSHDIRTPINAIMGMTGIALKNTDNEEKIRDCLSKIDGSSQHLLSLVNDVLDMSRIESGKTVMKEEPFSLRECLNNCSSIISGQLVNRDIALIRDFERIKASAVKGDELHLRQVFINILGNSVKFTPDGGSISFRAWEEDAESGKTIFVFELSDTGIGMSEEFLPKIFEAFSQEEGGSRTTYKGTGLGMAITKSFIDLMGGTVEVESRLNEGTRFIVKVPMEVCELPEEAAAAGEDYSSLKGLKILIAEDNELNAEITQEILEDAGMSAVTAVNGAEAVRMFRESGEGEFAAILMDIMMPEMNGYEATKAIRDLLRPDAATIPIIALSANAYEEDIRMARESGMNAHVAKPVNPVAVYKELQHYTAGNGHRDGISLEGMNVLVAEDNELNAEIIADTLEESGMKAVIAPHGKAALDAFAASEPGSFNLILMDMQMPVMDGVTATREIRKLDRPDAKAVPILAMTANTIEEAGEAAGNAGMSGFLSKPLKIEEIKKYFAYAETKK